MAVEVLFGLLVYPVAEIKVDCICSFVVNSAFQSALVVSKYSQTLSFGMEHNSTYRVFQALGGYQKCSPVMRVSRKNSKEVS